MRTAFVLALLLAGAQLGWEHLHGGIAVHHVLNRADLPGLSNAWGLLTLPALAAWASGRIARRWPQGRTRIAIGFGVALLFGALISLGFVQDWPELSATALFSMIALALALPGYRPECWLGFVLGMMWTFGGVLPTLIGGGITGLSALIHLGLAPLLIRRCKALKA